MKEIDRGVDKWVSSISNRLVAFKIDELGNEYLIQCSVRGKMITDVISDKPTRQEVEQLFRKKESFQIYLDGRDANFP